MVNLALIRKRSAHYTRPWIGNKLMDSSIIYKETVMKRCETIWREALSDFPTSGLSLRKYCQERCLSYVRALYWLRRLATAEESALTFAVLRLPDSGQPLDSGGH